MNRARTAGALVASAAAVFAAAAQPARPHGIPTCVQFAAAISSMQSEVDGLRSAAVAPNTSAAEASLLRRRAEVEQARVDGLRHNARSCSTARGGSVRAVRSGTVDGVFALAGGSAATQAKLRVRPESPTRASIDLWETVHGQTITRYEKEMEKKIHLIVISDDFRRFEHVHPVPHSNGHMTLDLSVPVPGRYHLYADTMPQDAGQHVFRFDVRFGNASDALPVVAATPKTVRAGPYVVALSSLAPKAGGMTTLDVRISRNGAPANDLHPYLGGAAHAVFISARDLSYVHLHPVAANNPKAMCEMNMPGMNMPMPSPPAGTHVDPHLRMDVPVLTAGLYKLWLQFRAGDGIYVAPFVLRAG